MLGNVSACHLLLAETQPVMAMFTKQMNWVGAAHARRLRMCLYRHDVCVHFTVVKVHLSSNI